MKNKPAKLANEDNIGEAKYRVTRIFGNKSPETILMEKFTAQNSKNEIEVAKK